MSEEEAVAAKMIPPRKSQQLVMTREDSLSDYDDAGGTGELDLTSLPPGRMHAVKGHHRLTGSAPNLTSLYNMDGGGGCGTPGTPRSRSRSPSIGRDGKISATATTGNTGTYTTHDANSSISSYDEFDLDLLTDRAGTLDDLSESQRKLHCSNSKELHLPATVLERMSEDSLEDSHAFTDVVRTYVSSNASRVSHVSGSNAGDGMLEPLDECDEGLEENDSSLEDDMGDDSGFYPEDDDDAVGGGNNNNGGGGAPSTQTTTVILTNMENLELNDHHHHHNPDDTAGTTQGGYNSTDAARTGESISLQEEEAPSSQPTAS